MLLAHDFAVGGQILRYQHAEDFIIYYQYNIYFCSKLIPEETCSETSRNVSLPFQIIGLSVSKECVGEENLERGTQSWLSQSVCLHLQKIVVDKPFVEILAELKESRGFEAIYELSLPVKSISEDKMRQEINAPSVFNMDPLKLLYMLKEKNRAQDFFRRINKDNDDSVSPEEIKQLFRVRMV